MSNYLESCNNECKIIMLLLVVVLGFLLYKCYNKPSTCVKEGFFVDYYAATLTQAYATSEKINQEKIKNQYSLQEQGQRRVGNTTLADQYKKEYVDVAAAKIKELIRKGAK
jgi:hypothetical protein